MIKIEKILVPVDFSDGSSLAMDYAATLASEYGAQIHLLNVIEEEALHAGSLGDPLNMVEKWKKEALEQLKAFVPQKYADLPLVTKTEGGLVYEAIIDYAKEHDVNLIIIGAHGKTGFIDSWLGGTSYEVSRKSPCAVLTVRPTGKGFVSQENKVF